MPKAEKGRILAVQRQAAENGLLCSSRSLPSYLQGLWRQAPLYAHWKRLAALLRRMHTVRISLRIISALFAILQTGALFLLTLVFVLVLLLLGGVFMLVILLLSAIRSARSNHILSEICQGRTVCLLFMSESPSTFFWRNAKDLTDRGFLVLIVSPFWLSPRGMAQSGFYLTARREADRLYIIRKYYLFSLRRHILNREKSVYFY